MTTLEEQYRQASRGLSACPFCQSWAILQGHGGELWTVECSHCGASGPVVASMAGAASWWNRASSNTTAAGSDGQKQSGEQHGYPPRHPVRCPCSAAPPDDLTALEQAAAKATQEPERWEHAAVSLHWRDGKFNASSQSVDDDAFVRAATPQVVQALIARTRPAEAERDALQREVDHLREAVAEAITMGDARQPSWAIAAYLRQSTPASGPARREP